MTNLEILTTARAAIATPEQWTRYIRRTHRANGFAYCALGAIDTAGVDADTSPATAIVESVLRPDQRKRALNELWNWKLHDPAKAAIVAQFNNTHSHSEVLTAFDRAIERCRMVDSMAQTTELLLPALAEEA